MALAIFSILPLLFFSSVEIAAASPASQVPHQTVTIDGHSAGRVFDGVGAISASSSLLLYDYPKPERSQILDYLFKPDYGASLQILKVEIGSDSNSTTASEPSHMRTRNAVDCHRGIEWWLMKQARARNPKIKFYGLMWGAPGWIKRWWSADQVRYLKTWLGCAKANGLHIDYLGGANERYRPPPKASFFKLLHKALAKSYPDVNIIATDEHIPPHYWRVAKRIKADPAYGRAVDILGEHDVCHWRSHYKHCKASLAALNSGKPLWNSEQSTEDAAAGAGPLARAMTRNYIDARLTGNINWSLIASFYGDTRTGGTGLMLAETPWSGDYKVNKGIWVDAQTTQFVQPGWRYIDSASGYFTNGASFVTLRSPNSDDYTVVIETLDATTLETVKFIATGGLSTGAMSVWSTDLASHNPRDWFVHERTQRSSKQGIELTLKPHHVYTLSTTTGQHKGWASPMIQRSPNAGPNVQGWLPLPYRQDFEHVDATHRAPYFQDIAGAFEVKPCGGGRHGTCYRQVITKQPLLWHHHGKTPATLIGDPTWWGDYQVSTDAMLDQPGYVELLGRVEAYQPDVIAGYHFRIASNGQWRLYSQGVRGTNTRLASGTTSFGVGKWHRLSLRFEGSHIVASIDGRSLAKVTDTRHTTGQVGFMVSPWKRAEFDNLAVVKTRPWPRFVPHSGMKATATSTQPGEYYHHIYTANQAIDGRIESRWSSQLNPSLALPQAITLDLGHSYMIYGLTYQPPIDIGRGGRITEYTVSVSSDGKTFRKVAHGRWSADIATKIATWNRGVNARFIRLQATATSGAGAAASEINIALTPMN
jgi:O-glycosyl hydrolase